MALAPEPRNLPFWGKLSCINSKGYPELFNDKTLFFSYCSITAFAAVFSLIFAFFLFFKINDLRHQEKGATTLRGQFSAVLAAVLSTLYLTAFLIRGKVLAPIEFFISAIQFLSAFVHYYQDGKVVVCSDPLLLYWAFMILAYGGWFVDAYLRNGLHESWILALNTILCFVILQFELNNNQRNPSNHLDDENVFSKITVGFATDFVYNDHGKTVSVDDIPRPSRSATSTKCFEGLSNSLSKFDSKGKYWVLWGAVDFVKYDLAFIIIMDILIELASFASPWLLQLLLTSLSEYSTGTSPIFKCYYFAVLYGVCPWIQNCLIIIQQLTRYQGSLKLRGAFKSVIYYKSMHLNVSARDEFDSGKIMNMAGDDTQQMFELVDNIPSLLSSPIALVLCFYQLWKLLGPSVLASVVIYVLFVPMSSFFSQRLGTLFPLFSKAEDDRTKNTANAFRNIKSLKLYAWEIPYFDRIVELRKTELNIVKSWQFCLTGLTAIYLTLNEFVSVSVFTLFLYLNLGTLSPELVFPALQFADLATGYTKVWPDSIPVIYRTLNAQNRIVELMRQKNQENLNWYREKLGPQDFENPTLVVENIKTSWNGEDDSNKVPLDGVSFRATRGDLLCVIGRVGSGKTALLKAIGGELDIIRGSINIWGSIAYCSQEAWLQNYTLRNNILFGQVYEEEWYNKVIDCCELLEDTKQMENGDLTQIGERGITLSGGQKARVALARAVYARADILLLDDVLSAVDEHVGAQLIKKLFGVNGILVNRTVILATNNIKVLPHSSRIISLENKTIIESKSFKEVVQERENSAIYRLIQEFGHAEDLHLDAEETVDRKLSVKQKEDVKVTNCLPLLRDVPLETEAVNYRSRNDEEEGEEDKVKISTFQVYLRYFRYIHPAYSVVMVGVVVLSILSNNAVIVYLGYMTNKELSNINEAKFYLLAFVGLVILQAFTDCLGIIWGQVVISFRLSQIIHSKMLWNVLHLPMSYFDVTPMGRLINRFSRDLMVVDDDVALVSRTFMKMMISLAVILIGITIGSPVLIVIFFPMGFIALNVAKHYIPNRRKMSRLTAAANSPVMSFIEESLKGQSTIRAFDRIDFFSDVFNLRVDYTVHLALFSRNLSRWLSVKMVNISTLLSLSSAISVVYLTNVGFINVGYAAVIIRFSLKAGEIVTSMISYVVSIETTSVDLERVWNLIDIKQEASVPTEIIEPDSKWPNRGDLEFKDLTVRYKLENPDVLKGLTFSVKAGEKIGIVGRTGSGKSTLTLALFRLLEANKGLIEIEGIDTSKLGLFDLRSRLSIIPQDAQIFNGSIRDNIDPLKTVDDAKLWEVLELCHLKHHLTSKGKDLDTHLSESGNNLSRGEAQLLCLGRALIRNSKVLVLDEATASVDVETDRIVQETIRKYFSDRTIITIAHRLNTIMDSDRVIVLDYGEIKEFDTPQNLLNQKGLFYSLQNAQKAEIDEAS